MVSFQKSYLTIHLRSQLGSSLQTVWLTPRQMVGWLVLDTIVTMGIGFFLGRIS